MKTLVITQDLLNANGEYIGADEVSQFDGHIEIAADLGVVKFSAGLRATGRIRSGAGSGIKAGEGIEAGSGIKAGDGIEAGWGIKAGWGIEAGDGIKAGGGIEAGDGIEAGSGIEAGEGIEAGWGIKAGSGIEAGEGIKAGEGIEAGGGIKAGLSINSKTVAAGLRIFAGLYMWRIPEPQEMEIKAELRGGTIAHGNHVTEATKAVPAGDKEAAA